MHPPAADVRAEFLRRAGWFDAAWYLQRCPEAGDSGGEPLTHYLECGTRQGIGPNAWIDGLRANPAGPAGSGSHSTAEARSVGPPDQSSVVAESLRQCEATLLAACGLFDETYYLDSNPDVAASGVDPLQHFCAHGWRELRKPRPDFDVWWYWSRYLDPSREAINPLVHYALLGQSAGYRGIPEHYAPRPGQAWSADDRPRRICLFAGYDPDGLIDDYVVDYVRELSRYADVYYLADGFMREAELNKIRPYTQGRWAKRHGAYDFGSYAALACDLVGWDVIGQYDELLLVNDSGYLLRSLDHVFARMDARACDWWGLQATKGIARTRGNPGNQFSQPIPLARVKSELVDGYEHDPLYDFHVGSYFLAYRQPVLRDAGFRRLLGSVHAQPGKLRTIQKYEIGLTHYLIGKGYDFDTFIDYLYPFHPLFTRSHFELIRQGFPLLKRYFLAHNHYDTPNLAQWKERILEWVPGAAVEVFERNLLRVADDEKLQRSFSITQDEYGDTVVPRLLDNEAFQRADCLTPKFDHWWAFPVCAYDHTFAGNERAVFEEVKDDPSIRKIILTRSRRVEADGENVVTVPLNSPQGQYHLLRSRQIFVKHGPRINAGFSLSPQLHNFINLWHGIPLKRFGYASLDMLDRLDWVAEENRGCRAVVCSSAVDRLAMTAAFHPLSYQDLWPIGLPRNDFILRPLQRMPADFQGQEARLRASLEGRRLVLFVPTFRNAQEQGSYRFSQEELSWLSDWQVRNNAVLGVREHMADTARAYTQQLSALGAMDLSIGRYPNIEVLYRVGSALITDYSSCVVDFLLTGRPVVSFAYDYDNYANRERGLFYDLEQVLPGPVCRDFGQLAAALESMFEEAPWQEDYAWKRGLFFDHLDDGSAWRVVKEVKRLYIGAGA